MSQSLIGRFKGLLGDHGTAREPRPENTSPEGGSAPAEATLSSSPRISAEPQVAELEDTVSHPSASSTGTNITPPRRSSLPTAGAEEAPASGDGSAIHGEQLDAPPVPEWISQPRVKTTDQLQNVDNGIVVAAIDNPEASQIYKPLQTSGAFRLVVLAKGHGEDPIVCTLKYSSLEDRPAFEALSYVWGDSTDPAQITLEGRPFYITRNLETALIKLRRESEDRVLWIDAICINQLNIPERNTHVRRMGSVYHTASRVIAWLGPETTHTKDMVALLESAKAHNFDQEWYLDQFEKDDSFSQFVLPLHMYTEPYWYRLWIVQEIAFAGDALFQYGDFSVDYSTVMRFLESFVAAIRSDVLLLDKLTLRNGMWPSIYNSFRNSGPNSIMLPGEGVKKSSAVVQTLERNRNKECRDPRDHIFGLLRLTDLSDSENPLLRIDYSKPADLVFRDAARAIIEDTKRLDVICSARREPRLTSNAPHWKKRLPSWTPDWSEKPAVGASLTNPVLSLCASGPAERASIRFSEDGTELTVLGICVGKIVSTNEPSPGPDDDSEVNEVVRLAWTAGRLIRWKKSFEETTAYRGKEAGEAFIRTLTAGWLSSGRYDAEDEALHVGHILEHIDRWDQRFHPDVPAAQEQSEEEIRREGKRVDGAFTAVERANLSLISQYTRGRKFFVFQQDTYEIKKNDMGEESFERGTTSRHLSGIAPITVQNGDYVCVLLGCTAPIILRPNSQDPDGERCTFMGEAYVDGFSNGEAVEGFTEGQFVLEEFILQ